MWIEALGVLKPNNIKKNRDNARKLLEADIEGPYMQSKANLKKVDIVY